VMTTITAMDRSVPVTSTAARVFVGMPLYNNARTLRRALDGICAQSESQFRVLMSDDGSSDETVSIAKEYCRYDPRFDLVVQPKNLNYGNFRVLLHASTEPFSVFLAGDDWWDPAFLEVCLRQLDQHPEAICAVTRVRFVHDDGRESASKSTASIVGSAAGRVETYVRDPGDNSRMYGVFRTRAARHAFPAHDFFAFDWAFSAASLLWGDHVESEAVLLNREVTPSANYMKYVRRDNSSFLARLFPLLPMTRDLLRRRELPRSIRLFRSLLRLNIVMHCWYAEKHWLRYHRVSARVLERLIDRL